VIDFLPPELIDWLRTVLHFDPHAVANDNGRRAKVLARLRLRPLFPVRPAS
jgi:hypothetical protein